MSHHIDSTIRRPSRNCACPPTHLHAIEPTNTPTPPLNTNTNTFHTTNLFM
eukprot:m.81759 g.81759  ORF g.81759 m.81759 type:complete len:51 (-) comp25446_c1_seq1:973-1125(-)